MFTHKGNTISNSKPNVKLLFAFESYIKSGIFEECTPRLYLNNQVEKSKESESPAIFTTEFQVSLWRN
jgi:hypothetical protein